MNKNKKTDFILLFITIMEKTLKKLDAYKRLEIEIEISKTRVELMELKKQIKN